MVQSLPLVVSIIVAIAAVPAALRELERRGLVRENYRGAQVAYPAGLAAIAASMIALGPVAIADHASDGDVWPAIGAPLGIVGMVLYVLGVAVLAAFTGERPEGSFGYKDSADQALPDLSD